MPTSSRNSDWRAVLAHLPADYERLATELKAVNAQWGNCQIKTASDLLQLTLLHVGADLPLRQTVAVVAEAGGVAVSHVVLHKRMRAAGDYFSALVAQMVCDVTHASPELWCGYDLCAIDATTACSPGADGTSARIHAVIRLSDLRILNVQVTEVAGGGETYRRFSWREGQLVIGDRGYASPPGIFSVVEQGADVLVRVNRGSLPLFDDYEEQIDLLAWCRSVEGRRVVERRAWVRTGSGRSQRLLRGRVVAVRLPPEEAADAKRRVRDELGSKATSDQLEAAEYVILFTTTTTEKFSAAKCIEAYRVRWQIELMFKRWKSLCHFDRLPNYRDDTIRSWLTAKVLLALVLDKMGSETSELFPPPPPRPDRRRKEFRAARTQTARAAAVETHQHLVAGAPRGADAHGAV